MKKLLLFLLCFPGIGWGQINVGSDQTICDGDIAQVIGITSVQSSTDSYQLTNITFAPEVIAGTPISLTDDDVQGPFPIGFTFQFYGNNYTEFYVGSNGWIGFTSGQPTALSAIPIPDSLGYMPRDCIMLSWEDLNPSTGGQVVYQTIGNAPNRKMVLTFDDVPYYLTTIPITSQVVLYEGSNVIDNHTIDKPLHTNPSVQGIHDLLGTSATVDSARNATIWSANQESVRYYASGISWYDVNSGQMIGVGDTLNYAPLQSTFVAGVITDSTGQTYSDTMYVEVLNTNISTTGFSLCNNNVVVLTAPSNFSTYAWSNGASTSALLTVNTAGTYYVDCMTSNGLSCQSDPITIYSGNIPITLSTPNSVFICQGDTVVMDGPLGYSSYSWSTGATTSSISTTSTGNYSLSVVDGNGCTGTSNTTSVSISPSTITATTTGFSLCNGSITLDAGSGFSSYQWYNNGTIMTNGTNQTFVATIAGNYTVGVTYPTGCTAVSNPIFIFDQTFNFFINTIGNDSLCLPNGQVVLDAGNYSTFNWSTGETTQQISVNTLGGSYSVNVTDVNGCPGVSNPPFTVYSIVNTSVISGPINPTQFQTVTYSVNPTSGSTYNWTLVGGTIESGQGTNSIDVKWNNSGMFSFSVIETDVNGCVGEEETFLVNVIISSIQDLNTNNTQLTKITDVLGRESKQKSNVPLFYIFDDGTVEKRMVIE